MVLANRCASGADTPPWARFIALHPRKGIALVDIDSPDAAVAPLEDFLSGAGLPALRDGAPPIVPVAAGGGEASAIADRLDAALAPMPGTIGSPSWSDCAIELLLTAPDLALTRIRRVAPTTGVIRAEPSRYPSHAVEAWHVLLARSGMPGPDSALLDWPPTHSWRPLAAVAALLLVMIGVHAVQEFGPSRFHAVATPRSTAAASAPYTTADMLPRAMILPTPLPAIVVTTTVLLETEIPPSIPPVATLTPPRQTIVTSQPTTIVTPQLKPATPAWLTDTNDRQRAPPRPKIALAPSLATMSLAIANPAPKRGVDPAWYDQGATTASSAGLTAFVAPGARNDELIPANLGTAHLASGTTATLDFYGDGLLNIAISGHALARAIDPSTGKPLGASVGNTRTIKAARGNVLVTANVAANVVDDVINTSGVVQASNASEQNGQIVLNGGPGGSDGTMQVAGMKDPSDNPSGEKASASGSQPEDQSVVYTTTAVTVAQDAAVEAKPIAASVGGTVTGAVAQGAADASATTTSVGKAATDVPTTVTHVGGTIGSTLTNTVNSLTKPVTSLAPSVR